MANKITKTNITPTDFVPAGSRYANSTVLYYGDDNILTFNTYRKKNIETNNRDKYMAIPPGLAYRPDIVSQISYGTCDFWWRIMEANNIKDIFEFTVGKTIRIPAAVI